MNKQDLKSRLEYWVNEAKTTKSKIAVAIAFNQVKECEVLRIFDPRLIHQERKVEYLNGFTHQIITKNTDISALTKKLYKHFIRKIKRG